MQSGLGAMPSDAGNSTRRQHYDDGKTLKGVARLRIFESRQRQRTEHDEDYKQSQELDAGAFSQSYGSPE